jgi:VanZ family protein
MQIIFSYFNERKALSLVLAVIWTIIILIGCSLPGKDLPAITVFDQFDKVVHFTFFFAFFFFWYCGMHSFSHKALLIICSAFILGFAIEFYQMYFVAGRSFDVWDGVADTVGSLVAWLCFKKYF